MIDWDRDQRFGFRPKQQFSRLFVALKKKQSLGLLILKKQIVRQFKLYIAYMVQTIPEMHKHLQKTTAFIAIINSHPGQFTTHDYQEFKDLIEEIRADALTRITEFFNNKHSSKCELYQSQITNYSENGESVSERLSKFRKDLEEATVELKKQQNRREKIMDSFSQKYSEHILLKKAWKLLEDNRRQRQLAKQLDKKMDAVYRKNLLKKAFFPWRTLTYKEGYQNTVRNQTEKDITSIHEQYQSIIQILKQKISETDEMIKIKRAAKGEFAFALSKNLLKTISNLSLQVMSLNQMALKDGQCEEGETKKFMKTVDNVISQKLGKVREYKKTILGQENDQVDQRGKRKKKITFV